ncbi:MAG: hypothetical protein VKP62_13235 [Candidatus Sericytochromatia bacterium]|nr:hypothetical protein [Candidatus Sericytochromatia bacterium]
MPHPIALLGLTVWLSLGTTCLAAEPAASPVPTPGRPDGEGFVRGALPRAQAFIVVPGLSLATSEEVTPSARPKLERAVRALWRIQRPLDKVTEVKLEATSWHQQMVAAAEQGRRICKLYGRLPVRVTAQEAAGPPTTWQAVLCLEEEHSRVTLTIEGPVR